MDVEFQKVIMRFFGRSVALIIPIIAIFLLLPHENDFDYQSLMLVLFFAFLLDMVILVIPLRIFEPKKSYIFICFFVGLIFLAATLYMIIATGGVKSHFFPVFLILTSFSTILFNSPIASFALVATSCAVYSVLMIRFAGFRQDDFQLLTAQILTLLLFAYFINRIQFEGRELERVKNEALRELKLLSEMNQATSKFVSAVSFEMRTPLTSIQGFSEMLLKQELPPEKEREFIEIIDKGAEHLSSLIEELLDISRLESGRAKLKKEEVELIDLLRDTVKALEPVCPPEEVIIELPADLPPLFLDKNRMEKVMNSIFTHIKKSCVSGAVVRLNAKVEESKLVLTINYRPQGDLYVQSSDFLFRSMEFEKKEEVLEIAIARRIITAHKGTMNIVYIPGQWSTIVFRLPIISMEDLLAEEKAV